MYALEDRGDDRRHPVLQAMGRGEQRFTTSDLGRYLKGTAHGADGHSVLALRPRLGRRRAAVTRRSAVTQRGNTAHARAIQRGVWRRTKNEPRLA